MTFRQFLHPAGDQQTPQRAKSKDANLPQPSKPTKTTFSQPLAKPDEESLLHCNLG